MAGDNRRDFERMLADAARRKELAKQTTAGAGVDAGRQFQETLAAAAKARQRARLPADGIGQVDARKEFVKELEQAARRRHAEAGRTVSRPPTKVEVPAVAPSTQNTSADEEPGRLSETRKMGSGEKIIGFVPAPVDVRDEDIVEEGANDAQPAVPPVADTAGVENVVDVKDVRSVEDVGDGESVPGPIEPPAVPRNKRIVEKQSKDPYEERRARVRVALEKLPEAARRFSDKIANLFPHAIERQAKELSSRYDDMAAAVNDLLKDDRMAPYRVEFRKRADKLLKQLKQKARKVGYTGVSAAEKKEAVDGFNVIYAGLERLHSEYVGRCERDQMRGKEKKKAEPIRADATTGKEGLTELSQEGGELLEAMRKELADLPNPFDKMEAGESDFGYKRKREVIKERVQRIAGIVLLKFGNVKRPELELVVQQMTDELLDRGEVFAAHWLVRQLGFGREGFEVVLDPERLRSVPEELFKRGEVLSLDGTESDYEYCENKRRPSPSEVKEIYGNLLSEGKIARCLAMWNFAKKRPDIYPKELLHFDSSPAFRDKFFESYRGAVQGLKERIFAGKVEFDTSDEKAIKERLFPYSDLAVANGMSGFNLRKLCETLGVKWP